MACCNESKECRCWPCYKGSTSIKVIPCDSSFNYQPCCEKPPPPRGNAMPLNPKATLRQIQGKNGLPFSLYLTNSSTMTVDSYKFVKPKNEGVKYASYNRVLMRRRAAEQNYC